VMNAKAVVADVSREFAAAFGRSYGLFESYRLEDAERVLVAINSVCGEIKEVVDELRDAGERVGLLKIRLFRPFPYDEVREALRNARLVTVLDRSESFGAYGPLFNEIRAALYDLEPRPMVAGRTFGLGGRDLSVTDIRDLFEEARRCLESGTRPQVSGYLGVRGE
jgi:pyruvate ferredoxin oxidoreductase alpha subunit